MRYKTFHVSVGNRIELPTNAQIHMLEPETEKAIEHELFAAGVKRALTIQLFELLMISSLIAFVYGRVHAAELINDPLPTVQENVATHKAVLADVREPGEWNQGHAEGAIPLPLSSLRNGIQAR